MKAICADLSVLNGARTGKQKIWIYDPTQKNGSESKTLVCCNMSSRLDQTENAILFVQRLHISLEIFRFIKC